MLDPYLVSRLDTAAPSATPVGLSRALQLGLVVLAALVVGGAVLRLARPKPKVTDRLMRFVTRRARPSARRLGRRARRGVPARGGRVRRRLRSAGRGAALLGVHGAARPRRAGGRLHGAALVVAGALPVIGAMALFVVAQGVSALVSSVSPSVTAEGVSDSLKDLVFLVVVILLVTAAPEQSRWPALAGAIVAPLALVCSFAVVNQWVLGNGFDFFGFDVVTTALGVGVLAPRHAGALPDANFWGRFLALGLPFALALIATSRPGLVAHLGERSRRAATRHMERVTPSRRLVALVAVALMAAGLYLTGSRGAFIAAGLGTLVFLVAVAVPVRRMLWGLPLGGAGARHPRRRQSPVQLVLRRGLRPARWGGRFRRRAPGHPAGGHADGREPPADRRGTERLPRDLRAGVREHGPDLEPGGGSAQPLPGAVGRDRAGRSARLAGRGRGRPHPRPAGGGPHPPVRRPRDPPAASPSLPRP